MRLVYCLAVVCVCDVVVACLPDLPPWLRGFNAAGAVWCAISCVVLFMARRRK